MCVKLVDSHSSRLVRDGLHTQESFVYTGVTCCCVSPKKVLCMPNNGCVLNKLYIDISIS